MSRFPFDYPPGATPLDLNEIDGLIPDYITTQAELNALERENITAATNWAESSEVEGALRDEYISALKGADQGDYAALIRFVRS